MAAQTHRLTVTRRIDILRSLLRSAARGVGSGLRTLLPTEALGRALDDLRQRRVLISPARLTSALAHAPHVQSASVALRDRRIDVDAVFASGPTLQVGLEPRAVRFAPRGAKEVVFQVVPPSLVADPRVADITSAVAGVIAEDIYRFAVGDGRSSDVSGAIVEREGADLLRVDLRTVPFVRRAAGSGALAVLLDVLEVAALYVETQGLRLELKLPRLR
jgi:hypothetical protein